MKHAGRTYRVVIGSNFNDDSVTEEEFNIQLAPNKYETILVPKVVKKNTNKLNAPDKYGMILEHNKKKYLLLPKVHLIFTKKY